MSKPETLKRMPNIFLNNRVFSFLLNRFVLAILSLIIFFISYIFVMGGAQLGLINASGSVIIVFGILLTIKHNFLHDTKSLKSAITKHFNMGNMGDLDIEIKPEYVNPTVEAVWDEYAGIILLILGTLLNAYGNYIPVVKCGT